MTNFTKHIINRIELSKVRNSRLTMGTFDGCHIGHKTILDKADYAITFSPSPKVFFSQKEEVLTTMEEKASLYKNFIFINFDKYIASLTADKFMEELIEVFQPREIIVGWDFHFGKDSKGNTQLINKYAQKHRIQLSVVDPVRIDNTTIKSTTIRQLVRKGNILKANSYLGYNYRYCSKVVHGKGIGSTLGFPTVNLEPIDQKLIPHSGVYAGYVVIDNKEYKTAISITKKDKIDIEGHILDFSGDVYSQHICMIFKEFIREQKKFNNHTQLIKQIDKDIAKIRTVLK
ncbi:MAG: riboflavin biosynthesis protein RibF [Clostridiales bacterium GWF2_36_10]|nr:MAG: riboflavin biosynthesis protein RibF [Clostridiales bacterium GWF2_36_10]